MRINKLAPSARIQGRWLCHLEDGTILRVTENEIAAFGLCSGLELSPERLEQVERAAKAAAVRDKALDLLSARPLSRKELTDRLARREGDRAGAEEAADWLEGLGLLNDGEYARTVVRHYAAKGFGVKKIRDELYRRGVPRELWEDALAGLDDPAETLDRLLAARLKGREPDREALKKASDYLARRGFGWQDIAAALRRYGAEGEFEE